MTEPRVESVADGTVVVTGDPDRVLAALLAALLVEPDDARLQALVGGTEEALELAGLDIRRFRNAIDLLRIGAAPTWTVRTPGGATATVGGELIERLFDQAYEHRRMAQRATFPRGGRLCGGRFTITEALRGSPDRGMYRAREAGSDASYLVTLGPPQQRALAELQVQLALAVPGVAPLVAIAPLEPLAEAGHVGMIEREPAGMPAATYAPAGGALAVDVAARLTLHVARVVATAGRAIGGLRPELIYVDPTTHAVTQIAPRAERFWLTGQPRSYGVPACFDQFFQPPEQLARPLDPPQLAGDVFALGAMLACWLTGEHPFEGEGAAQAIAIATHRRRPWRGPGTLAALIDGALALDPQHRPALAALIDQLAPLTG